MERLKGTFLKEIRHIHNPQGIPQVRLIRAEFQHGLLIADPRVGTLRNLTSLRRKFLKGRRQHFLAGPEHILLGGKAHLKIQLIKFTWRPVGSGILIPEAGSDLEVFIKARYHQELLILLRRLGQGVEFSFMSAGGHDVISGPLRRGRTQDRRLDLQKAHLRHLLTQKTDHLGAENDIVFYLAVS